VRIKNHHRIAAALVILLTGAAGCSKPHKKASPVRLDIVCTFLPVYVIAQNVAQGVPGISLQLLISPQIGCPHDYAMTPSEAALLEKADVLIMNGLGMEKFLQGSPALQRKNLRVINATPSVDPLVSQVGALKVPNPHAWVSPFQAAHMTQYLGFQLAQLDAQHAQVYLSNAQMYAARLDSLGQAFRGVVEHAVNRRIVTFHDAFDYFARDLGLAIIDVVEADPGVEPSARALSDLAKRIQERQVVAIFSEPQYSDRLAKTLSSETGVPVYSLDPAASGPSDPESYYRIMKQNLLTLKKALQLNP